MGKNSLRLTDKGFETLLKIAQAGVYESAGCKRPEWITKQHKNYVGDDDHLPTWKRTATIAAKVSDKPVLLHS
jgi:hypothetical protein